MRFYKLFLIGLLLTLSAGKLFATHYYGVDLFYTHVSGNTYRVSIVAFGDCSGEQFPTFATSRPRIHIMKGNTEFLTDFLDPEPPREGVEVTPVCPDELDNTTCVNPNGTVPGVKKFVYSKEFTLSGPASDWKFVFSGETDGNILAGRSNSLTNVSPPGIIGLEARLDNTKYFNSSPEYTTIATPFYCVNLPTNFNPGAVDADGDSLLYELVPGLDSATPVIYITGFSGSNPLDVAPGSFSFSKRTGQLTFTPRVIQKSLVVYQVSEYRNGVLVGTSMREMTVVILPCDNNPPAGYVSNASGATIADSVTVRTCKGIDEVAFDINPADADAGNIINMAVNGLPGGARLDITGNNTVTPLSRFVWNIQGVPEGDYTFFITYTDDDCPIASRQTQAYTVRIAANKISIETLGEGCSNQGFIKVTSPEGWSPWSYTIYNGSEPVDSLKNIASNTGSDSIASGYYKVHAVNYFGCTADTMADVPYACDLADVPNAFSPNGDGSNDILYVRGAKDVQEIHFSVFNRWGKLVFETNDIKVGWDGRYNGQDAPVEAYAYVLSVIFRNKEVFQKQGNITLLR